MQYYTKSEIARQLGISRTVVTQYLKDFNYDGKDVLEYVKQKYVENNNKKGAGTHSAYNEMKNRINELEFQLNEKDKIIADLKSKIDELTKNKKNTTKNKQNDLTESSTIEDRPVTNSKIQLKKIIINKNTNKPNIELIRIVKYALDEGNHNWKQIAQEYGIKRDTVEKYSIRIKKGVYDKYLKEL
jgi:transposase